MKKKRAKRKTKLRYSSTDSADFCVLFCFPFNELGDADVLEGKEMYMYLFKSL